MANPRYTYIYLIWNFLSYQRPFEQILKGKDHAHMFIFKPRRLVFAFLLWRERQFIPICNLSHEMFWNFLRNQDG